MALVGRAPHAAFGSRGGEGPSGPREALLPERAGARERARRGLPWRSGWCPRGRARCRRGGRGGRSGREAAGAFVAVSRRAPTAVPGGSPVPWRVPRTERPAASPRGPARGGSAGPARACPVSSVCLSVLTAPAAAEAANGTGICLPWARRSSSFAEGWCRTAVAAPTAGCGRGPPVTRGCAPPRGGLAPVCVLVVVKRSAPRLLEWRLEPCQTYCETVRERVGFDTCSYNRGGKVEGKLSGFFKPITGRINHFLVEIQQLI